MPFIQILKKCLQDGSVDDLADRLEVTRSTIYRWLSGKSVPTVRHQKKIQELLNVGESFKDFTLIFEISGYIIGTYPAYAPKSKIYLRGLNLFDLWDGSHQQLTLIIKTVSSGIPVYTEGCFMIKGAHVISQGWYYPTKYPDRIRYVEKYVDIYIP